MPNTQRILPSTVRRIAKQYSGTNGHDILTVSPQVRYARVYETDENYLFLWLKVSEDKNYFERDYRYKHGMRGGMIFVPGSSEHLSRQHTWFRDSKNSQLCVVINHIPHDITDEELDRVVEERRKNFGGDDVIFDTRRTFISF